jgi:hypothetical protein
MIRFQIILDYNLLNVFNFVLVITSQFFRICHVNCFLSIIQFNCSSADETMFTHYTVTITEGQLCCLTCSVVDFPLVFHLCEHQHPLIIPINLNLVPSLDTGI